MEENNEIKNNQNISQTEQLDENNANNIQNSQPNTQNNSLKKVNIRHIIRPIVFVAILLTIILSLGNLFAITLDVKIVRITGYREEKANSLDFVAIGNSEIYCAYAPAVMFKEYGYTSYNCGQTQQTMQQTYGWLQDIFKYQSPSLIIWEIENIFEYKPITVQTFADNFGLFMRHDNWKQLGILTNKKGREEARRSKGFVRIDGVEGYFGGNSYMTRTDLKMDTHKKYIKYIEKIVNICKQHNAELLLVKTASRVWSNDRYDATQKIADQYNLKYTDFNTNYDSSGIDLKIHTRDGGKHLNTDGARITTEFIGNFIDNNYSLTKKNNYDQTSWDLCVKDFYG